MKLPEKIVSSVISDYPVSTDGLIILLKVQSGTKNPYYILFPKTDKAGRAELTRDDFIGQFEDHWVTGLMDYNGSIDSANPIVEVSLFDPTWSLQNRKLALAWSLLKHESSKWASRRQEYDDRISCRNLEFLAVPQSIDLERTDVIKVKVIPRNAEQRAA